jgi:uncharacterized membrane protein YgcG
MADTTIGIEVTADTEAAQQAFDDLTEAIYEQTTAARVDGEEQKSLAKTIAVGKEAQIAAAEAVRRAQSALAEHSATVAAHGRESKEAAASLDKLKRAQAEAAKASEAASKAVTAAATATTKAVKETDKLTPSLKRAANEVKQTAVNADRAAAEVRKLELAIVAAGKASAAGAASSTSWGVRVAASLFTFEKGLGLVKEGIRWAIDNNPKLGASYANLAYEADKAGHALADGLLGRGLRGIMDVSTSVLGFTNELADSIAVAGHASATLGERLEALARKGKGLGALGELAVGSLGSDGQRDLAEARKEGDRKRFAEARKAAILAEQEERRQEALNDARARDALARAANAERASEAAKAPKENKGPTFADAMAQPKHLVELERGANEKALAARVAAYEQESAIREGRIAGMQREMEVIEAYADLERQQVDAIFFNLDVKNTAADRHDALVDRQINKELELARWQLDNAVTYEDIARARTRVEEAEHRKRLAALSKVVAEEQREMAKRQKVFETVGNAIVATGDAIMNGIIAQAEGEKAAIWRMLAELLKATAKKHAILALGEFAQAAGNAAMYNFPGAAAHAAAGGMHTAVAAAAGLGAHVAGQIWEDRREPAKAGAGGGGGSGGSSSGGSSSGGSGSPRSGEGLMHQQVPVSHDQLNRAGGMAPASEGGGVVVNITGGTFIGAGGIREVAHEIRKELERQDRGGKRARL